MTAEQIIEKIKSDNKDPKYWRELVEEVDIFFNTAEDAEKEKLGRFWTDVLYMTYFSLEEKYR